LKTSPQIDALAAALAKAQGEMSPASKDSTNPHFRTKYADLASAWLAAQGPISRNGLSVIQGFEPGPDKSLVINTMLAHTSGQWVESTLVFYPLDFKPQTLGSCITYGRRYSLMAILGIVPDDDDDGNASSSPPPRQTRPVPPPAPAPMPVIKFDIKNEAHRAGFKAMMKRWFPEVPESLYPTIAQACQGAACQDEVLRDIANAFLAKQEPVTM
jgi:ERF superfamily